jgi:hypothetical protein
MGIKGDLTFHKVAQSIKEMSIDIVAQFVGMVTKILAEVALLKAADVATNGMVSMVLMAYNNSASLLNYASGGKWDYGQYNRQLDTENQMIDYRSVKWKLIPNVHQSSNRFLRKLRMNDGVA